LCSCNINIINGKVNTSWIAILSNGLNCHVHISIGNVNVSCLIAILIVLIEILMWVELQCWGSGSNGNVNGDAWVARLIIVKWMIVMMFRSQCYCSSKLKC